MNVRRFFDWLRGWSPWHLRRQLAEQCGEQTARAMLMQLRVHQESVRHRTGYMVSAFIPTGVIEKLIAMPERCSDFRNVVASVLVGNALSGLFKRSQATNKLTALVFEPITKRGQNVKLVGGIFETAEGPDFVPMIPSKSNDHKQLHDRK